MTRRDALLALGLLGLGTGKIARQPFQDFRLIEGGILGRTCPAGSRRRNPAAGDQHQQQQGCDGERNGVEAGDIGHLQVVSRMKQGPDGSPGAGSCAGTGPGTSDLHPARSPDAGLAGAGRS